MRSRAASIFTALFLLALLLPVYWAVISSFTPENRLFAAPSLIPHNLVLQHYRALFATRDFWTPIRNSLVVAALTTMMSVALGSMCAYAIARLRFRESAAARARARRLDVSANLDRRSAVSAAPRAAAAEHLPGPGAAVSLFAKPLTVSCSILSTWWSPRSWVMSGVS
jgi:hypothetical protein